MSRCVQTFDCWCSFKGYSSVMTGSNLINVTQQNWAGIQRWTSAARGCKIKMSLRVNSRFNDRLARAHAQFLKPRVHFKARLEKQVEARGWKSSKTKLREEKLEWVQEKQTGKKKMTRWRFKEPDRLLAAVMFNYFQRRGIKGFAGYTHLSRTYSEWRLKVFKCFFSLLGGK